MKPLVPFPKNPACAASTKSGTTTLSEASPFDTVNTHDVAAVESRVEYEREPDSQAGPHEQSHPKITHTAITSRKQRDRTG